MIHPIRNSDQPSDRILENRIAEHLFERDAVVLPPLHVTAQMGTVTLQGLVDSHVTRRTILVIVRQVPGVQRVIDDIDVPIAGDGDLCGRTRHRFSPALTRYFEERQQGLVSDSAVVWDN